MDNPIPAPTPTPDNNKAKRPKGKINKAHLQALIDTEALLLVMSKPDVHDTLVTDTGVDGEITQALIDGLTADITTGKGLITQIVTKIDSKEGATGAGGKAKKVLVRAIRQVQKRAKQKYAARDPKRADYFIGSVIDADRSTLETVADSISTLLKIDMLPKLDDGIRDGLAVAIKKYKDTKTDQGTEQTSANSARVAFEQLIASISARRRQILHAADADWPHTDRANAGIRKELGLPRGREFEG